MAWHQDFPTNPYKIIDPKVRWFPAAEDLRDQGWEKLLPPLVSEIRKKVFTWRKENYVGVSPTSQILLNYWFNNEHIDSQTGIEFKYYFAQRESVETIIYLYEIAEVREPLDLLRFDTRWKTLSRNSFNEDWLRLVIKMATGSGKTKVLSLLIAWSYFHKQYEENSNLARNFLLLTPNIIVLDRIKSDFSGNRIFFKDPVLPENGYEGRDWKNDFQIDLHLQDDVRINKKIGNIFLTNVHRIYENDVKTPSLSDEDQRNYFLGLRPTGKTNQDKTDLGEIVRNIDELVILNDEAHHIHDSKMAWFSSIKDITNKMKQEGKALSLQLDVTATPKDVKGNIFPQTICDYPLAEAIIQNVVKHPVIPDGASESRLVEKTSIYFVEKYKDFIDCGYKEWESKHDKFLKRDKKSLLFLMVDNTNNCDEVGDYLEKTYSKLRNKVLVIHTNAKGDISESRANEKVLVELRKQANKIDSRESPYLAIVSVMMLKEGWDVKNVSTIVGLRPYSSKANVLAEQTLGRGLRKMFGNEEEKVTIIGNPNFMKFIKSIKSEGVILKQEALGGPPDSLVIGTRADEGLDIKYPLLKPRLVREMTSLEELDLEKFSFSPFTLKNYNEEELKQITFNKIITENNQEEKSHSLKFKKDEIEPNHLIRWFVDKLASELRFASQSYILYGKLKLFLKDYVFVESVDLYDPNVMKNFSRPEITNLIIETFKRKINELITKELGETQVEKWVSLSTVKDFYMNLSSGKEIIFTKKSIFDKMILDSGLEIEFIKKLESCPDIISYAKNYFNINQAFGVNFNVTYKKTDGSIRNYYPDFFVKNNDKEIYIVETKGYENLEAVNKREALEKWCVDVNSIQKRYQYYSLYVEQKKFNEYKDRLFKFEEIINLFQ